MGGKVMENWKRLRYVVPFSVDLSKKSFGEYCNIINSIEDNPYEIMETKEQNMKPSTKYKWNRKSLMVKSEQDVYRYILDAFSDKGDVTELDETNIGCYWEYASTEKENCKQKNIIEMVWEPSKSSESSESGISSVIKEMGLKDMGLFLFKTGIGFLWYEIETDSISDVDELIDFQNRFKELGHTYKKGFEIKKDLVKKIYDDEIIIIRKDANKEDDIKPQKDANKENDIKLHNLEDSYIERGVWDRIIKENQIDSSLVRQTKYIEKNKLLIIDYYVKHSFSMGWWIHKRLEKIDAEFYPDRVCNSEEESVNIPDKALLFSYVLNKEKAEDKEKIAYYLTNGYKSSYELGNDARQEMQHPFDNVIWYTTKEGCVYYAEPDEDNFTFFYTNMYKKIMNDYFVLYIKALYQSYSLLKYAIRIEETFVAESDSYDLNKDADKVRENLASIKEIRMDINLFLVKSVATSVSHIHHQNRFYEYLLSQLRIKEDVKSVSAGLAALNELVRTEVEEEDKRIEKDKDNAEKKRDYEMNRIMSFIGLFTLISTLTDGLSFILFWRGKESWSGTNTIEKAFIVIAIFIVLRIMIRLISKLSKSKKEEKQQTKK